MIEIHHQDYFISIVDVIIALHHRINELLKIRPEDMLSYIDGFRGMCRTIEDETNIFIENVEADVEELPHISFDIKNKNITNEEFMVVHRNLTTISKKFINER